MHIDLKAMGFEPLKPKVGASFLGSWRGRPPLPRTFTVAVYATKSGIRLVSNDTESFEALCNGTNPWEHKGPVVWIDDTLWGCPLGGLMLGAMSQEQRLYTKIIEPGVFKSPKPVWKTAISLATREVLQRVAKIEHLHKATCMVEICTSPIFIQARNDIRVESWKTRTGEIKGSLQEKLRSAGRNYLQMVYKIPTEVCTKDFITIATHAKTIGIPETEFKW